MPHLCIIWPKPDRKPNLNTVYQYKEPPHLNFLHFWDEWDNIKYDKLLIIHVQEGLRSLRGEGLGWAQVGELNEALSGR